MTSSPIVYSRQFHQRFGLDYNSTPTLLDEVRGQRRQAFLEEEVIELGEAVSRGHLEAIAHELADVIYVAYGTAVSYGIEIDAVLAEVHRANMSKLGRDGRPKVADTGKVIKGEQYSPPQVAQVLRTQGWRQD